MFGSEAMLEQGRCHAQHLQAEALNLLLLVIELLVIIFVRVGLFFFWVVLGDFG